MPNVVVHANPGAVGTLSVRAHSQGKGLTVMMARQGIGADWAFALLRGTSQDLNVKPATSLAVSHIDIEGR